MTRHGSIVDLGGTFTDVDHARDPTIARVVVKSGPVPSNGASCAQARRQFLAEGAASLHVDRLIDRFMRHAHHRISRELNPQPPRHLLRRPQPLPHPRIDTFSKNLVDNELANLRSPTIVAR